MYQWKRFVKSGPGLLYNILKHGFDLVETMTARNRAIDLLVHIPAGFSRKQDTPDCICLNIKTKYTKNLRLYTIPRLRFFIAIIIYFDKLERSCIFIKDRKV